jgi:hypothetical protein
MVIDNQMEPGSGPESAGHDLRLSDGDGRSTAGTAFFLGLLKANGREGDPDTVKTFA